jgi:hypothetical protein
VLLASAGWEGKQEGKAAERFCDVVGTELLMPAPVFRQDLKEELSLLRLRQLQERYGSSLQATAYRFAELGKKRLLRPEPATSCEYVAPCAVSRDWRTNNFVS